MLYILGCILVIFVVFCLPRIVRSLKNNKIYENDESESKNEENPISIDAIEPATELKARELIQIQEKNIEIFQEYNDARSFGKVILFSLPIVSFFIGICGETFVLLRDDFDNMDFFYWIILAIPWLLYCLAGMPVTCYDAINVFKWLTKYDIDYTLSKNEIIIKGPANGDLNDGILLKNEISIKGTPGALIDGVLLKERPKIKSVYYLKIFFFVTMLILFSVLFRKNVYPIFAEYHFDIEKIFSCFKTSGGVLCCAVFVIGIILQLCFSYYIIKKRAELFEEYTQK